MGRQRLPKGVDGRQLPVVGGLWLGLAAWGVGCTFDSAGTAQRGAGPSVDDSTGSNMQETGESPEDSGSTPDGSDASEGPEGSATSSSSTSGASTGPVDRAELDVVDGSNIDVGTAAMNESLRATVTLDNRGTRPATELVASLSSGAFEFSGGSYPGAEGDCGASLEPDSTCTLELSFSPTLLGPTLVDLILEYDDGEGSRELRATLLGAGSGRSDNLLDNPGAETQGAPPPGWTAVTGPWDTADAFVTARTGEAAFFAGVEPDLEVFELRQSVDLDLFSRAIESDEGLDTRWRGHARSLALDDNEFRVVLEYRDGTSMTVDQFDTGWGTANDWRLVEHERTAPVGTRSILVRLLCRKDSGNRCDAYFDDLSLEVAYQDS